MTLIKSGKGSGKTEQVAQLIAALPAARHHPAHRPPGRPLAGAGAALRPRPVPRLQGRDGGPQRPGRSPRLAICADSLVHLDAATLPAYDYIIMDESEQELRHLTSSTVAPKRKSVWVTQNALLKRAGAHHLHGCRYVGADLPLHGAPVRYRRHRRY